MAVTSPITAADTARAAYRNQPEGGVGVVSGSDSQNLFGRLKEIAGGFVQRTAATALDIAKTASMAIPGASHQAVSAARAGFTIGGAIAGGVEKAGEGIKQGFNKATIILTLVLAFVAWRLLK